LRLDLTIGLIHVIAQQIQKIRSCIVALAKCVANWKVLSNFILVHFSNFPATKVNWKNRDYQKFLLMQGYLS